MAAYIYKRFKFFDVEFADKFAAPIATLKIENLGAFKKDKERVYQLLETYEALK